MQQRQQQRWSQCSQGCTSYCVRLSGSRQVTHSALRSTSPLASETTSFSLRNWRSSRRGRFIARLSADKSESPPVIHSNDRHDVTLETNHLGLVTTKRSVVRSKNKQKGRIWIVAPSRCLWRPSMRDSYERFQRSMLSHHYHGELRFIQDVVINHRINPFLTTKTSRDKQKPT